MSYAILPDQLFPSHPQKPSVILVPPRYLQGTEVKKAFVHATTRAYASEHGLRVVHGSAQDPRFRLIYGLGSGETPNPSFASPVSQARLDYDDDLRDIIPPNKFAAFYKQWRAYMGLEPAKSTDTENRHSASEAQKTIDPHLLHAPIHPPTTRREALAALRHFISHNLIHFGRFEDVTIGSSVTPHSCLSAALNCGLILPCEILRALQKVWKQVQHGSGERKRLIWNSIEAYQRQLAWRHYMWFIFQNCVRRGICSPQGRILSGAGRHLNAVVRRGHSISWSRAPQIVQVPYKQAMETGYTHHIPRLMILGGWFLMSGVSSEAAYRWFFESYVDAYDWVMFGNVYGMLYGQLAERSGGIMRRLYYCSDVYLRRMTRELSDEDGFQEWRDLWIDFTKK